MATTEQEKSPISCHILDTSLGKPAANVRVILELIPERSSATSGRPTQQTWSAATDKDGRVKVWSTEGSSAPAPGEDQQESVAQAAAKGPTRWTLSFDTEGYFGGRDKTFFPEVVVAFNVVPGQHYHVPLLLSPYSYSTYRGS